jgi:hypothetical protein
MCSVNHEHTELCGVVDIQEVCSTGIRVTNTNKAMH